MSLPEQLDRMDNLAGCTAHSIQSLEALWPAEAPVSWTEAYMVAKHRARTPGADRHDGRTVAFLEGFIAAHALSPADRYRRALEAVHTYLRLKPGQMHRSFGEACGVDACILCLAEAMARAALNQQ